MVASVDKSVRQVFGLPNAATMVVSVVESVSDPEENPSSILPPPSKNKKDYK